MEVRKAKETDNKEIINVANRAFERVRYSGYDFKITMPAVYRGKDFFKYHYVCEEDRQIVAVAGNLIRDIKINKVFSKFSNIGTVSTLPSYQGKGCMNLLMKEIDKENIKNNIDFSILTGDRKRYNHFGFEKVGFIFKLNINKRLIENQNYKDIFISKVVNKNEISEMYNIYLKNTKLALRDEENLYSSLKSRKHEIFLIKKDHSVIGYYALDKNGESIDEFYLKEFTFFEPIISAILRKTKKEKIYFTINPFDKEYFYRLERLSEDINIIDDLQIKVYNLENMLKTIFELNKKIKDFKNESYIYNIDGKSYKITIKNNKLKIKTGNYSSKNTYSLAQFLRHIFSPIECYDQNKLSLVFALNYADLF